MPSPKSGSGSAFNKPQTTALFQRDRALATQNRSVAVQRNDTARESVVLQLISSSNLEVGRRTQALGEVRCAMKMARDLRLRELQPPCGKECTCTGGSNFLCPNRKRNPSPKEAAVANAVRKALREYHLESHRQSGDDAVSGKLASAPPNLYITRTNSHRA